MASELLLEIGTEEIPARMAPPAAKQLAELFAKEIEALELSAESVETYSTPRRLVLVARGLPTRQADREEEKQGPAVNIAFDETGAPTKAAIGFARGQGIDVAELQRIATDKGEYVAVRRTVIGKPVAELLPEVLPRMIGRLHFPKSMRWGDEQRAFVRPVHWMVALLDGQVVPFEFAGVTTGAESRGHRFLAPEVFPVTGADDYLAKIAAAHVVLDTEERRRRIEADIAATARALGGRLLDDPGLLEEVVHLIEEPVTTTGHFDEDFLELPKEVLVAAMRGHQRYFSFESEDGKLLNAFAVVSNTRARDMDVVTRGNERVLQGRLDDARFFFAEDKNRKLEDFLPALEQRVFLKPLGSMREKAERIATLSGRFAELLAPEASKDATRAGLLAKADLPSAIVGEFPELQGVMGREYARRSGEPEAVTEAIFEHYLPRFAGDILPSTDAGAIAALADKADSIAGCFGIGLIPTYAQDPYALRRQALGIIQILESRGWTLPLGELFQPAMEGYGDRLDTTGPELMEQILEFVTGRLRHRLAADYPTDVVDAVLAADGTIVVDVIAKVRALADLRERPDFEPLAAAFKRVMNIIRELAPETLTPAELAEPAEQALHAAHEAIVARVAPLVAQRDFDGALRTITELKPAVDDFFDNVMVMVDDEAVRRNRVALLQSIATTFRGLADFTRIQVERG